MKALDLPAARWAMVAAWVAANILLSHRSQVPSPGIPGADKVLHAAEYALLAFLLARAAFPSLRRLPVIRRWAAIVLACFLYGTADELHQAFVPGRSCDTLDVIADTAGAAMVAAASLRRRPRRD